MDYSMHVTLAYEASCKDPRMDGKTAGCRTSLESHKACVLDMPHGMHASRLGCRLSY